MSSTHGKTLIAIPTYNEKENAPEMCRQLLAQGLDADILFVDDNSPDGTGAILDALASQYPRVSVMHRSGKQGIGTAHLAAIRHAYARGYDTLVTMDCDFTHSPSDIARLLEKHADFDVTVGSRYMQRDSLPGWNLMRRCLTSLGHILTRTLLGMSYDATGAFRVYRLGQIPQELWDLVKAPGYSFFFESLFILHFNRFAIGELPIVLPARTYGHSKMTFVEASKSARQVMTLALACRLSPGQFRAVQPLHEIDPSIYDPQDWNAYWERKSRKSSIVYDLIASLYRQMFIRPNLRRALCNTFAPQSRLLHAGCGAGQVDAGVQQIMRITGLDISVAALRQYQQNNPNAVDVVHGNILGLSFPDASFDGVYNLGVMEHFEESEILTILSEFHRVLAPCGKLVLFWPHRQAPSVYVLNFAHYVFNKLLGRRVQFHPPEVSLLRSRQQVMNLLQRSQFRMTGFSLGPRDLFIQAVIVAEKIAVAPEMPVLERLPHAA
jgi:dolichol-phosphate mannosyltransferase